MAFFLFIFGFGEKSFVVKDGFFLFFILGYGKSEGAAKFNIGIGILFIIGVNHKPSYCRENAKLNEQMMEARIE